jgi:SAM-dependent methyltransferase
MNGLDRLLRHPATGNFDLDDPRTIVIRREILQQKRFLQRIYSDWYQNILAVMPQGDGPVVEMGSGVGYLSGVLPGAITSDLLFVSHVRAVLDGCRLPFAAGSLRAIVMTNVFHHLPHPEAFLYDAERSLRPGGIVAMVEPWFTPWSRLVYGRLHHEPFNSAAESWELPKGGPLSGANGALPWIVFERDRARFEAAFLGLRVRSIRPLMPFSYLLSGGFSALAPMPGWSFRLWRAIERALEPLNPWLAMFALIVLDRVPAAERVPGGTAIPGGEGGP